MDDRVAKMYQAAWLHYECGRSQKEVAEKLKVNKATVSRWIRDASNEGIVSIRVSPPGLRELEVRFAHEFDLQHVRVIPSLPSGRSGATQLAAAGGLGFGGESVEDAQCEELGKAAAALVGEQLEGGSAVGLGGGRRLASFARNLCHHCPPVSSAYYALGVSSREPFTISATSLTAICASLVATEFRRRAADAPTPRPVPKVEAYALRLPERDSDRAGLAASAEEYYEDSMKHLDIVVAAIGGVERCWVLTEDEREKLMTEHGAVGDILFDIYGEGATRINVDPEAPVFPFTTTRLERLVESGKQVIVLACGRASAVYQALVPRRKRFVTGIVADEKTAREILAQQVAASADDQRGGTRNKKPRHGRRAR